MFFTTYRLKCCCEILPLSHLGTSLSPAGSKWLSLSDIPRCQISAEGLEGARATKFQQKVHSSTECSGPPAGYILS
jgi:hypothetical protein